RPPGAGGRDRVAVVIDDNRPAGAYPGPPHGRLEYGRVRQRVPASGARRPGQIPVQVGEDSPRQVTGEVTVSTRRATEPPADIEYYWRAPTVLLRGLWRGVGPPGG